MTTHWTPTPSQTAGPFLHLGLTDACSVARVAGEGVGANEYGSPVACWMGRARRFRTR